MAELSSQVVNSSIYGQEAGVFQVNQGCAEKQQWKNKLLVRTSSTAPVLLESDFGGVLPLCTHSINQKNGTSASLVVLHFLLYIPNPLSHRYIDVLNSKYIVKSS